jgi:hypothetical protein
MKIWKVFSALNIPWEFLAGAGSFSLSWVPAALSLGVKRPESEADHSPPSSAEVKDCVELYLHFSNTPSWRGALLKKKHRDNFIFTFTTPTRPPLGPTQPPILLLRGFKGSDCESDHTSSSSTKAKKHGATPPSSPTSSCRGALLWSTRTSLPLTSLVFVQNDNAVGLNFNSYLS